MGTDPMRRARARRGMRVGHRFTLVLFAMPPFLFELHALNPSGARGRPPKKLPLVLFSCRRTFKRLEFLVLLDRRIVTVLLLAS